MLFINSFTGNAGTLPKWQDTWSQDPVRCPHLPFNWHQAAPQPSFLSTPAPLEIQVPVLAGSCSISQDALQADWWSRTLGLSWSLPKKKVMLAAARVGQCQTWSLCCQAPLPQWLRSPFALSSVADQQQKREIIKPKWFQKVKGIQVLSQTPCELPEISLYPLSCKASVWSFTAPKTTFCMFSKHHLKTPNV